MDSFDQRFRHISLSSSIIVLLIVWSLSGVYALRFVDRGWIPYDDGMLAHSAERVLNGELPHRDFDEIYTGGLSFLHAVALQLFGINLLSIRVTLLLFFLAFIPGLYVIALRFSSPVIAGLVTLLGVVWSVPNYFAGMPSWYNLFFATFGTLALIRHIETQQSKWLFIAGLCGGVSFLVKVSGVYFIAGAVVFLTYREQVLSLDTSGNRGTNRFAFFYLKAFFYVLFIGAVVSLIKSRLGPMEVFHFVLPVLGICGTLLWSEFREGRGAFAGRLKRLLQLLFSLCVGVSLPIALFLIPYILSNSLGDFYRGVFIAPQKRFQYGSMDFPHFLNVIASLPYALLLTIRFSPRRSILDRISEAVLILPLAWALGSAGSFYVYQVVWQSVKPLAVVAVFAGCLMIILPLRSRLVSYSKRQMLLLLVIMTAWLSLIQFPYAASVYFCYTAPLIGLTLLAVVSLQANAPRFLHAAILSFYFLFALFWNNPGALLALGIRYIDYRPENVLDLGRGGIRVTESEKDLYTRLVALIQHHPGAGYIYAAPDCPEVYFLSGMHNPTRKIYDFLGDSENEPGIISALLERKGVETVVINRRPRFSDKMNSEIAMLLKERFPKSLNLGQFTVRWKN